MGAVPGAGPTDLLPGGRRGSLGLQQDRRGLEGHGQPGQGDGSRAWGPPNAGGEAAYYLAANRTVGTYFNLTDGPGMMGGLRTHFLANAWERWYNGWVELQTGANHANSDVQGATSLTATNGEFTLRDYVTTGDVMRIKLPNSSQYLWLENHQFISALDGRVGYLSNTQNPLASGAALRIVARTFSSFSRNSGAAAAAGCPARHYRHGGRRSQQPKQPS